MERFTGCNEVIYDANIIVYYCFLSGEIKILDWTNRSRELTHYLTGSDYKIITPEFIINEIKKKTISKIVSEYLDNPNNIYNLVGVHGTPRPSLKLRVKNKVEKNFEDFQNKRWFVKEEYAPDDGELHSLKKFFDSNKGTSKMNRLLERKKRDIACPSNADLSLILFSKAKKSSVVSHDYDLTCFSEELVKAGLSYDIVSLKDIKYIR